MLTAIMLTVIILSVGAPLLKPLRSLFPDISMILKTVITNYMGQVFDKTSVTVTVPLCRTAVQGGQGKQSHSGCLRCFRKKTLPVYMNCDHCVEWFGISSWINLCLCLHCVCALRERWFTELVTIILRSLCHNLKFILWSSYNHLMIILQSSYDHLMIILWSSFCPNLKIILWSNYDYFTTVLKSFYDYIVIILSCF